MHKSRKSQGSSRYQTPPALQIPEMSSMAPAPVPAGAATLPLNFWVLTPPALDSNVRYCRSVFTRRTATLSARLDQIRDMLTAVAPIFYEVLDAHSMITKLYFDIDKAWDGVPTPADCMRVLEAALNFLRDTLHVMDGFAVCQAHRAGKISFHITCSGLVADRPAMKKIAMLSQSQDLGFDTAVYNHSRQLMRTVFGQGEKSDSVPFWPVEGYVGTFSDHIIQAKASCLQRVIRSNEIPTLPPRPFVSSGTSVVEDLLAAIDFPMVPSHQDRLRLWATLKAAGLRALFDFKMIQVRPEFDGSSSQTRLASAWHHTVTEGAFVGTDDLCRLVGSQSAEIFARYRTRSLVSTAPVDPPPMPVAMPRPAVPWAVELPQSRVMTPPPFSPRMIRPTTPRPAVALPVIPSDVTITPFEASFIVSALNIKISMTKSILAKMQSGAMPALPSIDRTYVIALMDEQIVRFSSMRDKFQQLA